jgi:hypothetical protein
MYLLSPPPKLLDYRTFCQTLTASSFCPVNQAHNIWHCHQLDNMCILILKRAGLTECAIEWQKACPAQPRAVSKSIPGMKEKQGKGMSSFLFIRRASHERVIKMLLPEGRTTAGSWVDEAWFVSIRFHSDTFQ